MKWGEISWIWILLALFVGVVLGFAVFGELQYYFPATFWFSIVAACFSGLGAILGQLKLWYEVRKLVRDGEKAKDEFRKLQLEVRKLEREEETTGRVIQPPSAEEMKTHGQSRVERALKERVNPLPFVVDSDEQKL